jgi:imidazolonepropionase-like amidohydrolase
MKDSSILTGQTVITKDDRIIQIGNKASIKVPANCITINGAGKYLVPGLCDMHIHLPYNPTDTAAIPGMLKLFIANGVTTVLNLLGMPLHLQVREKVNKGLLDGPTVYTSGFYINEPFVKTPRQVDSAVMAQKKDGVDVLKFHSPLSAEAYHQLMVSAKREKMLVVGHLPRNLGLEAALKEGQPVIAHVEEYVYAYILFDRPPKSFEEVDSLVNSLVKKTKESGTTVMTTLTSYRNIVGQVTNIDSVLNLSSMRYAPPEIFESFKPGKNIYTKAPFNKKSVGDYESVYRLMVMIIGRLNKAGVKLVFGTDCPVSAQVPGFSVYDEIRNLTEAGLSPYRILKAATINAAVMLKKEKEFGTIEKGKRADMVLIDANPFVNIENIKNRSGVMVRGHWNSRKELENMLNEAEK